MSARDFSKVSPSVWGSRRLRTLSSITVKYTFIYMLTSKHVNSAGCYTLPDAYACADLDLSLDQYVAARSELIQAGMILFDETTSELLIDLWFKHNPPMNDSHMSGTYRQLELIDSAFLKQVATERLEAANQKRKEAIAAAKDKKEQDKGRAEAEETVANITGLNHLGKTAYMKKASLRIAPS